LLMILLMALVWNQVFSNYALRVLLVSAIDQNRL